MFKTVQGRKIRVGLVGCGRISKNHLGAIDAHSNSLELGAVCDTDPVALIDHQERYAVKGYDQMEDMLRNEALDLVALCTPSGLHPDQAVLAAKHGVNVITEKPMATRWQDGVRMVRACDQANVRLLVVKQNRRNSTL